MSSSSPSSSSSSSTWSFMLNDTSPVYTYSPYADGVNTSLGWSLWYSGSGFSKYPPSGSAGAGTSQHFTSLAGASVSLQFNGVGIELHGSANSSYEVTLDGSSSTYTTANGSALFSQTGLTAGTHSVTLIAQPSLSNQMLGFQYALISNPVGSGSQPSPSPSFFSSADTSFMQYQGSWTKGTDQHIQNGTFYSTALTGASVGMEFMGEVVAVQGITNWGNMNYTVTLDGTESPTLNSSTYWFVPETTLFYQGGLDASKVHTLNLTQTSFEATDDPLKLGFDYVAVYGYQDPSSNSSSTNPNSDNSTSSHKSPVGGVVAGAVVGALALGLAIFVFVWWRRRRTRTRPNRIELLTEVGTTKMDMGNIGLGCGASPSATPLISADTGAGRREGGKFSHVHGSSLSASSSGGYDSARSVPRSATETPSLGYVAAMSDLGSDAGSGVPEGTAIASSGVLSRFNSTGEHASWRGQGLAGVSEETRSLGNNEKSPRVLSPSLRSLASSAALGSPITPGPGQNAAHGQGGAGAGTCGRPLPPPPGTTPSSPPVQIHSMYMHPPQQHSRDVVRSLVQEHVQHGQVQQPGGTGNNEEVDRILEMIAARIDQPEDHSMPPPEYPRR